MNVKVPEISEEQSVPDIEVYKREFPGKWDKYPIQYPSGTNNLKGSVLSGDEDKLLGVYVVDTVVRLLPEQERHLYVWSRQKPEWEEIRFTEQFRVKSPLLLHSDRAFLIFEDISGNPAFVGTKLNLYDFSAKSNKTIGYGYAAEVSPDRRKVVYCRSDGRGFNNVNYWDIDSRTVRVLFSYTEADPGDGTTIFYRWSSDSRVIYFSGRLRGFTKEASGGRISTENFFYRVAENRFMRFSSTNASDIKWK